MPTNSIEYKDDGIYYNGKLIPDIGSQTEKTSLDDNDVILLEDSADSNNKKKITKSNFTSSLVAGTDGQVQFNDSGSFGASADLFWDKANSRLGLGTNMPSSQFGLVNTDVQNVLAIQNQNAGIALYVKQESEGRAALFEATYSGDFGNDLRGVVNIENSSPTSALIVKQTGLLDGSAVSRRSAVQIYTDAANSSEAGLVYLRADNTSQTSPMLNVDNRGTGDCIKVLRGYPLVSYYDPKFVVDNEGRVGVRNENPDASITITGNLTEALTGTVSVGAGTNTVTGTGTLFTTELKVGYAIRIDRSIFTVSTITDDTNLTLSSNFTAGASGATAYRDGDLLAIDNGASTRKVVVNRDGNVGIGTDTPTEKLEVLDGRIFSNWGFRTSPGNLMFTDLADTTDSIRWSVPNDGVSHYRFTKNGPIDLFEVLNDGQVLMPSVYGDTVGATNRDLFIDSTGKLGYVASSERYKENIQDLTDVSWLHNLRPVTFDYINKEQGVDKTGLIAEEVEKINPKLVSYNENNQPETVLYSELVTPLLKQVQEQQKVIENLKSDNQTLKTEFQNLLARIEQLENK